MGDRGLAVENERALWLQGNPDELHRMILNLLDNAARHTPPTATVELRLRAEDGAAIVEVDDDGPGIAADLRTQIFDRFVRGDGPADTATGPGSGLGLAIVQAVAASHGGTAEVEESSHGGALFRVRIPIASAPRPSAPMALDRL
jgi:two-component system OmpR family sensor kinase